MEDWLRQFLIFIGALTPIVLLVASRFTLRDYGYKKADRYKEYVRDYLDAILPSIDDLDVDYLYLPEAPKRPGVFQALFRWIKRSVGIQLYNITIVFYGRNQLPSVHLISMYARSYSHVIQDFYSGYFEDMNTYVIDVESGEDDLELRDGYTQVLLRKDEKIGFVHFTR